MGDGGLPVSAPRRAVSAFWAVLLFDLAEDDAVPEGFDQRRGVGRHSGQPLSAGGVRSVDEPLQRLDDLGWPVAAGVGLGSVGQAAITRP
jgi:hypothetical protein